MKDDASPVNETHNIEEASIEVGEILRSSRFNFGYSLSDIEYALHIREAQVDAIENGDITQLPGKVYAIGFVRSYAEYLDLDADKIVDLFKIQYMDGQTKSKLSFPEITSENKSPAIIVIIISFFLYLTLSFGWHEFNRDNQTSKMKIYTVPEDIKSHLNRDILVSTNVDDGLATNFVKPINNAGVENMGDNQENKSGVVLNIVNSSWVEIKNSDGKIIVSNILEKGDEYFVPDSPGLSMSLGNAANVEIIINGRALMPLGKDGDVRRDIPLDTSYLMTLEFKELEEPL